LSEEKKATYGQIFWSWKTYWYALVIVTLATRGAVVSAFRIGDYSGAVTHLTLNPLICMVVVAAIRWNWQKPHTATAEK
jgi:hypothetical protein